MTPINSLNRSCPERVLGYMSMLRRRFRFRLRSLFILVSMLAVVAAFVARPIQAYRQERKALEDIPGSRRITHWPPLDQPPEQLSIYC